MAVPDTAGLVLEIHLPGSRSNHKKEEQVSGRRPRMHQGVPAAPTEKTGGCTVAGAAGQELGIIMDCTATD